MFPFVSKRLEKGPLENTLFLNHFICLGLCPFI